MRSRALLVAALSLLLAATASPALAGRAVTRDGSCSGRGEWTLRVRRETSTTIRVRFLIERADPGDTWQLFLSDNGIRIFSASRVADADGELRAVKVTSNRSGTDRIKGSGVNISSGGSCEGFLSYREGARSAGRSGLGTLVPL
jgi:hypothetical protein